MVIESLVFGFYGWDLNFQHVNGSRQWGRGVWKRVAGVAGTTSIP